MTAKKTTVAISGAFDPIHVGHIRYIHDAAQMGDKLVVILNSDDFLMRKKKSWRTSKAWIRSSLPWMKTRPLPKPWN